jgi:hypothetical protein
MRRAMTDEQIESARRVRLVCREVRGLQIGIFVGAAVVYCVCRLLGFDV